MLSPSSPHRMLRSSRSGLPRLLFLTVSLALSACDGADSPLAPANDPLTSASEPSPSDAAASGEGLAALATGQRILFMSYRFSDQPDLYKIDPSGGNLVHLAASAENESSAAWSYDNKRIALVRRRVDGTISRDDIYLINADGSNGHWARGAPSPWPIQSPSWSPDGSRLVLRVWIGDVAYLGWMEVATGQVAIFNPQSGGTPGGQPAYSATGQKIVYVGKGDKTIEQINADGSGHKTRYTSATSVDHPAFSPDGKKIAFNRYASTTGNNTEIFVKNLVTGVTTRLTKSAGGDEHPSWSPDGTRIAFMSARSGKSQIWTMNAATGGSLQRITNTNTHETNPTWSH